MVRVVVDHPPSRTFAESLMRVTTLVVLVAVMALPRVSLGDEAKPDAPRFNISKEITYVTGPERADGTIDYVAAINDRLSKGVTRENNPATLMVYSLTYIPAAARMHDP